MRGQDDVVQAGQRVVGGRRFVGEDVEPGPGEPAAAQRLVERVASTWPPLATLTRIRPGLEPS